MEVHQKGRELQRRFSNRIGTRSERNRFTYIGQLRRGINEGKDAGQFFMKRGEGEVLEESE